MRTVISANHEIYGGDFERILYLEDSIESNSLMLCLTGMSCALSIHLTSTEPKYKAWLITYALLLLTTSPESWFKSTYKTEPDAYYNEFQYTLKELETKIEKIT